jgi:hypothetical protein
MIVANLLSPLCPSAGLVAAIALTTFSDVFGVLAAVCRERTANVC